MVNPGDAGVAPDATAPGGGPNTTDFVAVRDTAGGETPPSAIDLTEVAEPAPASVQPSEPAAPRPIAAPLPVPGISSAGPRPDTVRAARPGGSSIVRRIATILAMIVLAGAVGYVLAFVSAQMVDQSGSGLPAVAGSVAASIAPSTATPGSVAPASAVAPSTAPAVTPATSVARASAVAGSESPVATVATSSVDTSPGYHVVARGETLTSIAADYGVTVQALAAANGISDLNTIYAGQRLVIPGH